MQRTLICALPLLLSACLESLNPANLQPPETNKPPFMVDEPYVLVVDGKDNDLVSAGLGIEGLRAPLPTTTEAGYRQLRRRAVHQNFNALLALKDLDGYGRLYAHHMVNQGPVAGTEYLLPVRYSDHAIAALLMLQVPDTFDPQSPCLIATASSGSRGIYGAAGVVAAWALHQGCAVVSTDKGTGTGFHLLDQALVNHWHGTSLTLNENTKRSAHFYAPDSEALKQYQREHPNRIATRHAHSTHLPEQDWGRFVLQAIQFGFYQLNQHHRPPALPEFRYLRSNTLVMAAAISNGGAAVLAAAEQDTEGWIDGLVVSEPNAFIPHGFRYIYNGQAFSTQSLLTTASKTALLAPCAALAENLVSPLAAYQLPLFGAHFAQRCADLAANGLIAGESQAEQAQNALAQLREAGLDERALPLLTTSSAIHLWEAILVNYANNFGRHKIEDNLCQLSYAFTDASGKPIAMPAEQQAWLFGNGGIPPVDGIQIVDNRSGRALAFASNAEGKPDLAFGATRCLAGVAQSSGIRQVEKSLELSGNLRGRPALVVQGSADNLIQPGQHARAYTVLNQRAESGNSQLRYIEVQQGQHFDAFLNLPPLRTHYVPLHAYMEQSLDSMLAHLRTGKPLPPNQLINAAPANNPLTPLAGLPAIAFNADTIAKSDQHRALHITGEGLQIQ